MGRIIASGCCRPPVVIVALGLMCAGVTPLEAQRADSLSHLAGAAGGDSTYADARVRAVVERAAATHASPPATLASFRAVTESEIAVLIRRADGEELVTQVEQVAGRVYWRRDGRLVQEVNGYRARLLGPSFSTLSFLRVPWVLAPLYGDRVPFIFVPDSAGRSPDEAADTAVGGTGEGERTGGPGRLIHPFASDRARFYRFSGGDTVLSLHLPERTVRLVRVVVEALRTPRDAMVFEGEIDLDASRHQIVRMHGRILGRPGRPSLVSRMINAALERHIFLELENAEREGSVWLPYRQRIEVDVTPYFSDDGSTLRILTAFSGTEVNGPVPAPPPDTSAAGRSRLLLIAPADSLSAYRQWVRDLGSATADHSARDFDDVAEGLPDPAAGPTLRFGTDGFSDVLRYDRVEGLFTGLGVRLDPGRAAPGTFFRLRGGYAWAESAVRGRAEVGTGGPQWEASVAVERQLASTNDFPRAFGNNPTILSLFGGDDIDYVDRSFAELRARLTPARGIELELSGGAARDDAPIQHVDRPPLGREFRPLRPVREAGYGYVRGTATLRGAVGGEFLSPGLGARLTVEAARGGLAWQRLEASVRDWRQRGRWSLAGEVNVGVVRSDDPSPQTLFELGGYSGRLPGFDYKAFSGDRAAVVAVQTMVALPAFESPLRFGQLFAPAIAPAIAGEVRAGWVGASDRTAALLERFAWTDSDGVRATVFLGMRLFAGAVRAGFARPLGERGKWRFEWGLDPGV